MGLDPQAKEFLDFLNSLGGPPIHELSPEKNRKGIRYIAAKTAPPSQEVAAVEDRIAPVQDREIKLRFYFPRGEGPHPIFVFFHGGGWVMGDVEIIDAPMRFIANNARSIVVSVDYRLAPEHKFPTAVNDCYQAIKWVSENAHEFGGDASSIGVGGESAGGNLAVTAALMSRERGAPSLSFQVLLYPPTDLSKEYPSQHMFDGYFLSREEIRYFENHYLRSEEDRKNIYASPLLAEDLSSLPPALLVTAEFDPLLDEGKAFAERLMEEGVEVDYRCFEGMIHGFFGFSGRIDKGKELIELISKYIKDRI